MAHVEVSARWANDQRHAPRVRISVPVLVKPRAGEESEAVPANTVQSRDLSVGGAYLIADGGAGFSPGELLTVEMCIPWEFRRAFPFSRLAGSCRVVRVEERGVALAFCGDQVTRFGSTLIPR